MMNLFKAKKWGAFILCGMLPIIFFMLGTGMASFLYGIIFMFVGIISSSVLASRLLKHAFTDMQEGTGLCTLTLDSTGIIQPFITTLAAPFIHGTLKGKEVDGVYNRDMVAYITPPVKTKHVRIPGEFWKDGKTRNCLVLPEEVDKPDQMFRLNQWPCFLFNKNTDSYLSKDELSTFEKDLFTKNNSLFILKKTQQLSGDIRDFARYIVEHAKPKKGGILENKKMLVVIVLIVVFIIFALLFGPALYSTLTGAASNAGNVIPSGGPIS